MLRKIRSPLLPVAYFSYAFKRGDPQEEWLFEHAGLQGRVVNGWRSGLSLWVGAQVVASTDRLLALGGGDPVLVAEVTDTCGQQRTIEVFARAIFTVSLRVVVDGQSLSQGYV